ncbi:MULTISPECIES: SDR family oxidoreductase [unclassified Sphingobium]|uniref:SDR family oxidoreductase n=1 Tax=unclassified Sphingobium TaxID=2611147 RepID=UPI0035A6EB5C
MRIVVIGGTGQVGSKVVQGLAGQGHDTVSASQESGVDIISGNGLRDAVDGADVVVDVTNKITMERGAAIAFFETAARNIVEAEVAAGVKHHVALSVLRSDRLAASGYIAGKVTQERQVEKGPVPYTLVRAAQFFELVPMMVQAGAVDGVTRLTGVKFQPIAAADVAQTLIERVLAGPINGSYEIAGPEVYRIDELAERWARETGSAARIEMDPDGTYFGAPLEDETLLPGHDVHVGTTTFEQWLASQPNSTRA